MARGPARRRVRQKTCMSTALNRWSATEMRWSKNAVSRASPVAAQDRRPISEIIIIIIIIISIMIFAICISITVCRRVLLRILVLSCTIFAFARWRATKASVQLTYRDWRICRWFRSWLWIHFVGRRGWRRPGTTATWVWRTAAHCGRSSSRIRCTCSRPSSRRPRPPSGRSTNRLLRWRSKDRRRCARSRTDNCTAGEWSPEFYWRCWLVCSRPCSRKVS